MSKYQEKLREVRSAMEGMQANRTTRSSPGVYRMLKEREEMLVQQIEANKGEYGGQCNRVACDRSPATWFNISTKAYYCPGCGRKINEVNGKFNGQDVCSYVEKPNDASTSGGVRDGSVSGSTV